MESTKFIELKVGTFVTLGLIILAASILALGGDRMLFTRYYYLQTHLSQVQGLVQGSIVSLAGLNVGNVTNIEFIAEKNLLKVTMKVEKRYQERLREGSLAEVKTQGALGDKFVFITPGPLTGSPIPDGGLVAATDGPDLISAIMGKGDSINQVFDVVKELNLLLKSLNAESRVSQIMQNLTNSSLALSSSSAKINAMLGEIGDSGAKSPSLPAGLKSSIAHLNSILKKIDDGEGSLGALINDPGLHNSLKQFLGTSPRQRYLKGFVREAIQTNEGSSK